MRKTLLLLAALLTTTACLGRHTPTMDMDDPGWVGCTMEEVMKVWGAVHESNEDAGLVLWTYTGRPDRAVAGEEPAARFWFDRGGLVSRYWIDPALVRSWGSQPPKSCRNRDSMP